MKIDEQSIHSETLMEKNKAMIAEKAIEADKHEKEIQIQNGDFTATRSNLEIISSQLIKLIGA